MPLILHYLAHTINQSLDISAYIQQLHVVIQLNFLTPDCYQWYPLIWRGLFSLRTTNLPRDYSQCAEWAAHRSILGRCWYQWRRRHCVLSIVFFRRRQRFFDDWKFQPCQCLRQFCAWWGWLWRVVDAGGSLGPSFTLPPRLLPLSHSIPRYLWSELPLLSLCFFRCILLCLKLIAEQHFPSYTYYRPLLKIVHTLHLLLWRSELGPRPYNRIQRSKWLLCQSPQHWSEWCRHHRLYQWPQYLL